MEQKKVMNSLTSLGFKAVLGKAVRVLAMNLWALAFFSKLGSAVYETSSSSSSSPVKDCQRCIETASWKAGEAELPGWFR